MFAFGRNWQKFLKVLDERRITDAEVALGRLLGREHLRGVRFLDAGSGSGLHSLAAYRLGASVVSVDLDTDSVACTLELRTRYGSADRWQVCQGSLTDAGFLLPLGKFDVVYCWGVAHHTGAMWRAVDNLLPLVADCGSLALALYNDQGQTSRRWAQVKRMYQSLPDSLRPLLVLSIAAAFGLKRFGAMILSMILRTLTLREPLLPIRLWIGEMTAGRRRDRGMDWWYDLVDWVGGWPYEVARPDAVFRHLRNRGFDLRELVTVDGPGCNEFVFTRGIGY